MIGATTQAAAGAMQHRLSFRLMVAVGLALMPLAILAYVQGSRVQDEAQARAEAAVFGETLLAAAPQVEAIKRARGSAEALALSMQPLLGDTAACTRILRRVVETDAGLSFAGFIPVDGNMTCASTGEPFSFAGNPRLAALVADPQPLMNVNPKGPISGESVLIFSHPAYAEDGRLLGFISLSLPHRALEPRIAGPGADIPGPQPLALATFDGDGTILTALYGIDTVAERLPMNRPLTDFVGGGADTFAAVTASGERQTFAVVPMVEGSLYILSAWPLSAAGKIGLQIPLWAFPAAMWLASLVVAWMAAEHQVLRHIRSLRRSIVAFARGSRTVELPRLEGAPSELRDVGDAYERMVDAVLHDEAALEDTVHQKEVLLREVHHRVKNNLQLIASIMNIQMRKAANAETRSVIKGLHDRVMSLATVHRELYQTTGLADVSADELLTTIVAQVRRLANAPGREIEAETHFDPIRLTPDQAVPLSLILTEAMTNIFKHGGTQAGGTLKLSVALERTEDGWARLRVSNGLAAVGDVRADLESTGLGGQLLQAFSTQLSGRLQTGPEDGAYVVTLDFPIKALTEAEHRHDAA